MSITTIDTVIFRISQRCNLDCKYCYVFKMGDSSWKSRPAITNNKVGYRLGERIREHCQKFNKCQMSIILHGGEPLLIGKRRFNELIRVLRDSANPIKLSICMQTNGLLLDHEWLEIFNRNKVVFSISLDGPPMIADTRRTYPNGKGCTLDLLKNIFNLKRTDDLYDKICQGYLCVINPNVDGKYIYNWFAKSGFHSFDFLIPDGNYVNPAIEPHEYLLLNKFLISSFDSWFDSTGSPPKIALFEHIMSGLFGAKHNLDAFGGDISAMLVVESNGAIGCHDVIRMCQGKFSSDSLDIFQNTLTDHQQFYQLDKIQHRHAKCMRCKYLFICGGGYLPHRFDGYSFNNPSCYCDVLFSLFSHIEERVKNSLPPNALKKHNNTVKLCQENGLQVTS